MDGWKTGRSFWGPSDFQRLLLLFLKKMIPVKPIYFRPFVDIVTLFCLRWFFTFYHGKSQLNHHFGNVFDFFQPPNKQIQVILGPFI